MSRKRVTSAALIKALRDYRGNMASCAREFGVTRQRIQQIVSADAELSAIVDEETETFIDVAESKLYEAIEAGNVVATIFFLKTRAKHRGYIERAELVPIQPTGIEVDLGAPIRTIENGETEALNGNQAPAALLE